MNRNEKRDKIRQLAVNISADPVKRLIQQYDGMSYIAAYGAGIIGYNASGFIKKTGLELSCFLDKRADEKPQYLGLPVYNPIDNPLSLKYRENTLVLLCFMLSSPEEYAEVESELTRAGYGKIINAFTYLGLGLLPFEENQCHRSFLAQEADAILAAFDLMSDTDSEDVFLTIFNAHASLNYDLPALSNAGATYVDVGLPFKYKYRNFVDCGAFIGDTLRDLVNKRNVERYIGFEPDSASFSELAKTAKSLADNLGFAMLLPLALSNQNSFVRFRATHDVSARIDELGSNIIQTARLDEMLPIIGELMIKMDIEGSEREALLGAQEIITHSAPDLAICVYHRIPDLWRIPLMLKDWVPGYRFFLRNHVYGTMETVLYATVI